MMDRMLWKSPAKINVTLHISKLGGYEATQFAAAVTNQNPVGRLTHVKADSECTDDFCDMAKTGRHRNESVLIGRSNGKINRLTANKFRRNQVSWYEIR